MEPLLSSQKFQQLIGEEASHSLRCAICLDVYEQPVFLLCGHSFCYSCIRDTALHVLSGKPHIPPWHVYIDCPHCRRPHNAFKVANNSIPPNFSLSAVTRALSDVKTPLPCEASTSTDCPEMKSVSTQTTIVHPALNTKSEHNRSTSAIACIPDLPGYTQVVMNASEYSTKQTRQKCPYTRERMNIIQSELEKVFSRLQHGSNIIHSAMSDINVIRKSAEKCDKSEVCSEHLKEAQFCNSEEVTSPWKIGTPISLETLMTSCDFQEVPLCSLKDNPCFCSRKSPRVKPCLCSNQTPILEDPAIVTGRVDLGGIGCCWCNHRANIEKGQLDTN